MWLDTKVLRSTMDLNASELEQDICRQLHIRWYHASERLWYPNAGMGRPYIQIQDALTVVGDVIAEMVEDPDLVRKVLLESTEKIVGGIKPAKVVSKELDEKFGG